MSEIDNTPTAEEIAQSYTAMGHSVELINGIIDGSKMVDEDPQDKKRYCQEKRRTFRNHGC
jgi:hypothetical protein